MQENGYTIVKDELVCKVSARDALLISKLNTLAGKNESVTVSFAAISTMFGWDTRTVAAAAESIKKAGFWDYTTSCGRGISTVWKKVHSLHLLAEEKKVHNLHLLDAKKGTKFAPNNNNIYNNNEKENNIKESAAINRSTAPKPQPRFIKPTIEQVRVYIAAKGYSVDAEHFYNYYESQGWRVGRNPMKDWQAAVRTWQAKEKQYGKHRTNSTIANAVEAAKLGIALADAQRAAGY